MKNQSSNLKNQAGITLLLSIFILSGLILIAVTVSSLAIQSIRNSRASVFSEPAIGQAQSGAEEGLWGIKRNASTVPPSCDPSDSTVGTKQSEALGTTTLWSARTVCQNFDNVNIDLSANTPYYIYLFDPLDRNGDIDLSNMQDGGYHSIQVTENNGTRNLNVYLTRFDGTPIGLQPVTVSPGGTIRIPPSGNLNNPSGADNRMILKLVYCESSCAAGSDKANVTVSTDIGIPTFPTINSTGCAQRGAGTGGQCTGNEVYNRKINVTVPQ